MKKTKNERWFVKVAVFGTAESMIPTVYALGPLDQWSRARHLASAWELEHGPNTTEVVYRRPEGDDLRLRTRA